MEDQSGIRIFALKKKIIRVCWNHDAQRVPDGAHARYPRLR